MLQTKWLDGTVADQISIAYTPFPLPYHNHTWQVNQLVPFFVDLCEHKNGLVEQSSSCQIDAYKDFAFEQQDTVLGETEMSKQDFIKQWSKLVADKFNFDVSTIELCYDRAKDPHDTEDKLRQMWKYGTGKGVENHGKILEASWKIMENPGEILVKSWRNPWSFACDSVNK